MMSTRAALFAVLFLLVGGAAAEAADPPGRVGRLSLIEGTVSQRAADADDWSPATLNYPVSSGHALWTEAGARAEIQVGELDIRLDQTTELEIVRLDDANTELALPQGFATFHLRALPANGVFVDTPQGPVRFTRPGRYHVEVLAKEDGTDEIEVAVFEGEAKLADSQLLRAGEGARLAGDPALLTRMPARGTTFDDWADARTRAAQAPRTLAHVSPQMTGYQDLDRHGTWAPAPDYGTVWYPTRVADDWAPYRYGHWAYVHPWGWTWIDDAPWGFAPFHYGRWVRIGPRWAWWPGHRRARPVYAPALVAFVGGDDWSVSISFGSRPIGWVPLAPHELYRPHYRTSATYVRNVNITTVNKTVIKNITVINRNTEVTKFANRGAATVVDRDSFRRGRKAHEAKVEMASRDFERAKVTTDTRRLKPERVEAKTEAARPTPRRDARPARASTNANARSFARPTSKPEPTKPQPIARETAKPAPQSAPSAAAAPAPKPDAKPARAAGKETPETAREVGVPKLQPPRPVPPGASKSAPQPDAAQAREPRRPTPGRAREMRESRPAPRDAANPSPQSAPAVVGTPAPKPDSKPAREARRPLPERPRDVRAPRPQTIQEARPVPRPQAKPVPPASRAEPRPQPRPEPRVAARPEPRPEPRVQRQPMPQPPAAQRAQPLPVPRQQAAPQPPARIERPEPPQAPGRIERPQRVDQARGGQRKPRPQDEPKG